MTAPPLWITAFCVLTVAGALTQTALADTAKDTRQNNAYVDCLIKRGINPPEMSKADVEFCLREADIPDPGEEARQIKGKAWRDCLVNRVVQLDDGVSPAKEIGQMVIGLCTNEWHDYVGVMWMNTSSKRKMANDVGKYAVGEGTQAVLFTRRAKRPNVN